MWSKVYTFHSFHENMASRHLTILFSRVHIRHFSASQLWSKKNQKSRSTLFLIGFLSRQLYSFSVSSFHHQCQFSHEKGMYVPFPIGPMRHGVYTLAQRSDGTVWYVINMTFLIAWQVSLHGAQLLALLDSAQHVLGTRQTIARSLCWKIRSSRTVVGASSNCFRIFVLSVLRLLLSSTMHASRNCTAAYRSSSSKKSKRKTLRRPTYC